MGTGAHAGCWTSVGRASGTSATGEADSEGGVDDMGAEVLHPVLLEAKVGHCPLIGGGGHECEIGRSVAEILIETDSEDGEKELISNLKHDVFELV